MGISFWQEKLLFIFEDQSQINKYKIIDHMIWIYSFEGLGWIYHLLWDFVPILCFVCLT